MFVQSRLPSEGIKAAGRARRSAGGSRPESPRTRSTRRERAVCSCPMNNLRVPTHRVQRRTSRRMLGGMRSLLWIGLLSLAAASACDLSAEGVGGGGLEDAGGGAGFDATSPTHDGEGSAESSVGQVDSGDGPPLDGSVVSDSPSAPDTLDAADAPDTCPPECTSCANGTCQIDCLDAGACPARVNCPAGLNCSVRCMGKNACAGGVGCSFFGFQSCTILCGTQDACQASDGGVAAITCNTGGKCTVTCTGKDACDSVSCNSGTCAISCTGNACEEATCTTGLLPFTCSTSCADGGCGQSLCCTAGIPNTCTQKPNCP
jgi:hypothetical protein